MAYQVLARKWRPQTFAELIGQEPIVKALQNALTEGRLAQAYLFSGIRGVGKTSAARLLAKALNCERGPTAEPCNECTPCIEITRGSDLDVIEVDAATYSKVEQVRELTESLKYGPARDRYKVAVLDEIHRLSRQAFDALLKIVEEPPAHLAFVFATTEVDAVPATILSRCQEFSFRRVPAEKLARHLATICASEKITAGDTALRLIARAGEGSVRDAVALLDQLATFGSGSISDEDAARLLGGLDAGLLHRLLTAMLAPEPAAVSAVVHRLEEEGWDPRQAFAQLLGYCRDALHLALGGDGARVDLPEDDAATLAATAREAGYENLLRLLHQLLASETGVRRSESPFLALEIAWLRAAELPRLTRIEDLLAGRASAPPAAAGGSPAGGAKPAEPAATERPAPEAVGRPAASAPVAEPATPAPPAAAATSAEPTAPAGGETSLGSFLELVGRHKQPLAAHLSEAEGLELEGERLVIYSSPGDEWLAKALTRGGNRRVLDEAVAEVWGEGAGWELREGRGEPATGDQQAQETPAAAGDEEVADNPTVQTVLDLFQGRVEEVEELGSGRED